MKASVALRKFSFSVKDGKLPTQKWSRVWSTSFLDRLRQRQELKVGLKDVAAMEIDLIKTQRLCSGLDLTFQDAWQERSNQVDMRLALAQKHLVNWWQPHIPGVLALSFPLVVHVFGNSSISHTANLLVSMTGTALSCQFIDRVDTYNSTVHERIVLDHVARLKKLKTNVETKQ